MAAIAVGIASASRHRSCGVSSLQRAAPRVAHPSGPQAARGTDVDRTGLGMGWSLSTADCGALPRQGHCVGCQDGAGLHRELSGCHPLRDAASGSSIVADRSAPAAATARERAKADGQRPSPWLSMSGTATLGARSRSPAISCLDCPAGRIRVETTAAGSSSSWQPLMPDTSAAGRHHR